MVNFNDMQFSLDELKSFDFDGDTVTVKQYLPIEGKNDLIQIALQQSEENGSYNDVKLDAYFHVYLALFYTDIIFSDEEKRDVFGTYDKLVMSGLLDQIIQNIPEEEFSYLFDNINLQKETNLKYKNSFACFVNDIIATLPAQAEKMKEVIDKVDFNKFQQVIDVAAATGMNNTLSPTT